MNEKYHSENDTHTFYVNDVTELLDNHCIRPFSNNPKLRNCKVLIAEDKNTGTKTYVVFENGKPIYANTFSDAVAVFIEVERFWRNLTKEVAE